MEINTYPKASGEKLAKNFALYELSCKGQACCNTTQVDSKLVEYLQRIRDHFGEEVIITSGYRCPVHNKAVGGASQSYHVKGMAADIMVQCVAPAEVAKYAESIGVLGIGLYESFVHIDTRTGKSFWYGYGEEYRETFGGAPAKAESKAAVELPVVARGDQGEAVRALQILLIGKNYECGVYGADGDFGPGTREAVIDFQNEHDLAADGIVGENTWAALLGLQ